MNTALNASHGNFEGKKEKLVNDLKGVVADADDLLKEVGSSTAEEFAVARTKVEGKLSEAKARLVDARTAVATRARGAAHATDEYARDNPWKIFGVAAAAGLLIGFFLSRR